MHPKPNQKLFLFIIQATILSIYFPSFLCETPNCNDDQPFRCGSISYLSYPFWGGSRPQGCGRPAFELFCQDGVPMLNISSLSYRVQVIDFRTNTLTVARQDLYNNTCPKVLHNTTINHRLFHYPSNSTDENVTLYFDCTDDDQSQLETLPNKFSCDVKKSAETTINLFKTSSGPGPNITCKNNIFVPVNQKAAQSLENPTASSINILQAALESGFSIQWIEDGSQRSRPFCNRNVYSSCVTKLYDRRNCNYLNTCSRTESIAAPIPSAAPEGRHGMGKKFWGHNWHSGMA